MGSTLAVAADLLVAILLAVTISTTLRLSRRMARLKADEAAMRKVVAELLVATGSAERSISGLREAVAESERTLSDRLDSAQHHAARLAEQVSAGEGIIQRVAQIADVSRRLAAVENGRDARAGPVASGAGDPSVDGLKATIMAARDVAARATRRLDGRAA